MKKYIFWGIPCVIAIIVALIFVFHSQDAIRYEAVKIDRGDIKKFVVATGTINPVRTVIIGSQVSGLITELYADFNSQVKKGQVVAQIDPVPFEHKVKREEANLATAVATLNKEKVTYRNNKKKYERAKKLFAKEIISVDEFDDAKTNFETSSADVKLAEAKVRQAKAALEIARTDLEHTVIVSPLNGIVISREVDVGQTVAASFQTPTLFTIAKDLTDMQINTNVNEADIGMVGVGQYAKFTVDAFPDDVFEGTVSKIHLSSVIFQNVVTYDTIIRVDNPSLKLKPGMTANTSILVAEAKDTLRVPNSALRYIPSKISKKGKPAHNGKEPADKDVSYIWLLENGELKKVPVKLGITDYDNTEIIEGDVEEGQEVVVAEIAAGSAQKGRKKVPW